MKCMMDIYFDKNYGKLYEKAEGGKAVCWKYSGEEGQISNQFILRKIPYDSGKEEWYDIVTPYGYGGPVIERISTSKEELIVAYEKAFGEYCRKNRIVSEFVRFHPIINNGADFQSIYNSQCIRHTVGTNLKAYDDPVTVEFSKKCRKNIRQALNKGVTWKITEIPDRLDGFREIYYSTMDRNNAGKYYYFDDEYFSNCLKWYKKQLLVVEAIYEKKTIAAGLCFISGNTIHIHLSGTLSEYLYLSPAYILRYAITIFGKKKWV